MPTIKQTIEKVRGFAKLPAGWHYGEGGAISDEMIAGAVGFLFKAEGWGIVEANAFPGVDGQIELTFYSENRTFAFMFETDGTVSITEETRGSIISDVYGQTLTIAEQYLPLNLSAKSN